MKTINDSNQPIAYTSSFFDANSKITKKSCQIIVPTVIRMLGDYKINSVIDVGCGSGSMLSSFITSGIYDITGVDGNWAENEFLQIPKENFVEMDLKRPSNHFDRKFDLVVSTEVAEHLEEQYAETFVDYLCSLGDVILFSAAISGQGGVHHVNEQPQSYWVKHFNKRNFQVFDFVRPAIWEDKDIIFYYKQNLFLFARTGSTGFHSLKEYLNKNLPFIPFNLVHPDSLLRANDPHTYGVKKSVWGLFYLTFRMNERSYLRISRQAHITIPPGMSPPGLLPFPAVSSACP